MKKNKLKFSSSKKNMTVFDEDILDIGSYAYTNKDIYSAYIATKKQSEKIIQLLNISLSDNSRILDIGCGDGTFTFEVLKIIKPKQILGFDIAEIAIKKAQGKIKRRNKKGIKFIISDIYSINKYVKKNEFDIGIMRGVLHHLSDPERAIAKVNKIIDKLIILEPNGYNPILKIIEKRSLYHIRHQEKSYWPLSLCKWFTSNGYTLKRKECFGIVPYFCNENIAKILKTIEPIFENIPYINRFYCGSSVYLFENEKK